MIVITQRYTSWTPSVLNSVDDEIAELTVKNLPPGTRSEIKRELTRLTEKLETQEKLMKLQSNNHQQLIKEKDNNHKNTIDLMKDQHEKLIDSKDLIIKILTNKLQ